MPDPAEPSFVIEIPGGQRFGPAPLTVIQQWARERRVPPHAVVTQDPGGEPRRAADHPALAHILATPQTFASDLNADGPRVVPVRNPAALTAYYLGIVALLPLVGLVVGPVAIGLGVTGLRKRRQNPRVHGSVHARVGIVLGIVGILIGLLALAGLVFGAVL